MYWFLQMSRLKRLESAEKLKFEIRTGNYAISNLFRII